MWDGVAVQKYFKWNHVHVELVKRRSSDQLQLGVSLDNMKSSSRRWPCNQTRRFSWFLYEGFLYKERLGKALTFSERLKPMWFKFVKLRLKFKRQLAGCGTKLFCKEVPRYCITWEFDLNKFSTSHRCRWGRNPEYKCTTCCYACCWKAADIHHAMQLAMWLVSIKGALVNATTLRSSMARPSKIISSTSRRNDKRISPKTRRGEWTICLVDWLGRWDLNGNWRWIVKWRITICIRNSTVDCYMHWVMGKTYLFTYGTAVHFLTENELAVFRFDQTCWISHVGSVLRLGDVIQDCGNLPGFLHILSVSVLNWDKSPFTWNMVAVTEGI